MTAQIRMIATAVQKITPIESPVIGIKRAPSIALLAAALCAVFHVIPAFAASPSLVASGDSTPAFTNTNYTLSIGSPAASDLVTVAVACVDNAAMVQPAFGTPSGFTRKVMTNQASAGLFAEHAVYYKIATGSEGATVALPISSMQNFDCGARYWKNTGYNTSTPIDCTDIAWAATLTPDPPSQAVAGGPLDVFVLAFASDRGDNSYSSGSDLTTNAHNNAGGISSGRTTDVSYGGYTAISAKDPGTFTNTANARTADALTCVIYPTGSAAAQAGLLGGPFKRLTKGKL